MKKIFLLYCLLVVTQIHSMAIESDEDAMVQDIMEPDRDARVQNISIFICRYCVQAGRARSFKNELDVNHHAATIHNIIAGPHIFVNNGEIKKRKRALITQDSELLPGSPFRTLSSFYAVENDDDPMMVDTQ